MNLGRSNRLDYRFAAGWGVLLLYAGACSPLGLALAVLVGSLDPNHQILSGAAEHRGRLVLHHANGCAPHHHGVAARALTLFAEPANAANPDHVLQFSSADAVKFQSRSVMPQADARPVSIVFHSGELSVQTLKVSDAGILICPPVGWGAPGVRSTVLLI